MNFWPSCGRGFVASMRVGGTFRIIDMKLNHVVLERVGG